MTASLIDAIAGWFSGVRFSEPDAFAVAFAPVDLEDDEDADEPAGRFDASLSPLDEFN